jgi:V/A-type H+-transporting ATPase subunit K
MVEYTIGLFYALLGAAIAMGMGGISAGLGVGVSGVSGTGVISEDPRKFGPVLVLQALPQTQGIYGFLGAIIIWIYVNGCLAMGSSISEGIGLAALAAGIVIGLTSITAIPQGMIAGSGMQSVAKRPETFGQSVVLAVMAETFAVFGLLIAILVFVVAGII